MFFRRKKVNLLNEKAGIEAFVGCEAHISAIIDMRNDFINQGKKNDFIKPKNKIELLKAQNELEGIDLFSL